MESTEILVLMNKMARDQGRLQMSLEPPNACAHTPAYIPMNTHRHTHTYVYPHTCGHAYTYAPHRPTHNTKYQGNIY